VDHRPHDLRRVVIREPCDPRRVVDHRPVDALMGRRRCSDGASAMPW
jgi:hypothetical protein